MSCRNGDGRSSGSPARRERLQAPTLWEVDLNFVAIPDRPGFCFAVRSRPHTNSERRLGRLRPITVDAADKKACGSPSTAHLKAAGLEPQDLQYLNPFPWLRSAVRKDSIPARSVFVPHDREVREP